jgi:hypothetical protein
MHELYNLKEMLCEELSNYGRSKELSPSSLQMIDMLAHACKNVCKIIESKDEEAYSMDGSYRGNSYYGNSRYSRDGYYYDDGGMSGRRGRAMNGRFVSRDASEMARKLREMMEEAPDEASKRDIQRLAEKMEQM